MPTHVDPADLVARALGHLDGPERERVDAAVAADPALAAELDRIAQHLLLYDALPDAPDAPAFERLAARIDATPQDGVADAADLPRAARSDDERPWHAFTRRRGLAIGTAAALLIAFAMSGWFQADETRSNGRVDARLGAGIEVLRGGSALVRVPIGAERSLELRAGDVLRADRPAEVTLAERVHVVIDSDSPLTVVDADRVSLRKGRARFDVAPGAFAVDTPAGPVEVLGTTFDVDLRYPDAAVRVIEGRVRFAGQTIEGGHVLSGGTLSPLGREAFEWLGPRLDLALTGGGEVRHGAPLDLALSFVNDGYARITADGTGGVRTALLIDIWRVASDGSRVGDVFSLAIHEENLGSGANLLERGQAVILEARERRTVSVRLLSPFPTPGRYRLRVWYGDEEGPRVPSNPLEVEVTE